MDASIRHSIASGTGSTGACATGMMCPRRHALRPRRPTDLFWQLAACGTCGPCSLLTHLILHSCRLHLISRAPFRYRRCPTGRDALFESSSHCWWHTSAARQRQLQTWSRMHSSASTTSQGPLPEHERGTASQHDNTARHASCSSGWLCRLLPVTHVNLSKYGDRFMFSALAFLSNSSTSPGAHRRGQKALLGAEQTPNESV